MSGRTRLDPVPSPGAVRPVGVEVSVVVPLSAVGDDPRELYVEHTAVLERHGYAHEFIFVLHGGDLDSLRALRRLEAEHTRVRVVTVTGAPGESAALSAGFEAARGTILVTLAHELQVEPSEIPGMIARLREDRCDMVVARRSPRRGSRLTRGQSVLFHWLTNTLAGTDYHDIGCGTRVLWRRVADDVRLYGSLHRFFPLLAHLKGFRVVERPVAQSQRGARRRMYPARVYFGRLLDLLTLYFLVRFTKTPLRFFGSAGLVVVAAGALVTAYLATYRLLGLGPIADRPLFVVGVFLIALGAQLFSVGLLGELIIFTHARDVKDYHLDDGPD